MPGSWEKVTAFYLRYIVCEKQSKKFPQRNVRAERGWAYGAVLSDNK